MTQLSSRAWLYLIISNLCLLISPIVVTQIYISPMKESIQQNRDSIAANRKNIDEISNNFQRLMPLMETLVLELHDNHVEMQKGRNKK